MSVAPPRARFQAITWALLLASVGMPGRVWLTVGHAQEPAVQTPAGQQGAVSGCTTLNLRAGPGTKYRTLSSLDCGNRVAVVSKTAVGSSTWVQVRLGDGRLGWVNAKYIEVEPAEAITDFVKTVDAINGTGAAGTPTGSCAAESGAQAEVRAQAPASDPLAEDRRPGRGTFKVLKSAVADLSGKACFKKLGELYRAKLGKPPQDPLWAELSEEKRAERILAHARRTGGLLNSGKARLYDLVTPELAACIAFQETRGNLTPHRANYTFCSPEGKGKYLSTAHGLGQMTRTTLRGMWDEGKLELTTVQGYENSSSSEVFEALNDDVPLQMEVLFRTLHEKARIAKASPTSGQLLEDAVFRYDTDHAEQYVSNVAGICLPCLKEGKSTPFQCLQQMR